ncbi:uncharacterized protein [Amphiura filiformis]|uniref:uncharacterized protein n=1 Tax=Amphiura filiformis TaxID=82378 RepID=UPI003B212F1B
MEQSLHVWVLTVLHALVFILGVPGNALIIRVFAKKQRKTSTHIFILGLAIADLYVCLSTAALIAYWFFEYDIASSLVCQGGYFSVVLGVYYSLFITTVIAIERYYAVCKPHEKIVTPFRARLAVVLSVVAAAFVSAPSLLFSDVIEGTVLDENFNNRTVYMCWPAPDDIAEWIGASAMYSIYVLSLVLVAALYGKVYTTIRDKVLGPTLSMRPGLSASMRSIDSTSRRSSTPLSKIDEAETDNIGKISTTQSPAKSNGSINHVNNDDISTKPSPSKSNGSVNTIRVEGVAVQCLEESSINVVTPDGGSTEHLVQKHEKEDEAYTNDGVDLRDDKEGKTNDTSPNNESQINTTNDVTNDSEDNQQSPTVALEDNSNQNETEEPSVVTKELGAVTNGVNNRLAVTPTNTAPSSPAVSPKKGPVVIDPAPSPLFQNRHFEPIKYDDEFDNDRENSRGGKRQSSLMSFRGFLRRQPGGSFNSQASTRSIASQRMQNKTTNMLLLVTIVTYVTWIPTLISSVILIETPDTRDQRFNETVITILLVMKMLFIVNHAANPFIYSIVNDRFRRDCLKELRQIFGCTPKRTF